VFFDSAHTFISLPYIHLELLASWRPSTLIKYSNDKRLIQLFLKYGSEVQKEVLNVHGAVRLCLRAKRPVPTQSVAQYYAAPILNSLHLTYFVDRRYVVNKPVGSN
jgi:hypothetical protein